MSFFTRKRSAAMAAGAALVVAVPLLANAQSADPVTTTPATTGWELIPRNTIGSPTVHVGTGPLANNQSAPGGDGSLQLLVEPDQKVAYGMPLTSADDLWGTPIADLGELSYWVMDGTEEEGGDASLPNITIEVARNGVDTGGYASFVFLPNDSTPVDGSEDLKNWEEFDTKAGMWFSTSGTDCALSAPCTWDELTTAYPDAEVWFSVSVAKGRDDAFEGAVDLVTVDGTTYDFEPGSVSGDEQAPVSGPDRLAGANRYETSVEIAAFRFPEGSPAVYLARGDVFADALAANALRGPVLIVETCELPEATEQYLRETTPDRVTALGGEAAICDEVLEQAKAAAGI